MTVRGGTDFGGPPILAAEAEVRSRPGSVGCQRLPSSVESPVESLQAPDAPSKSRFPRAATPLGSELSGLVRARDPRRREGIDPERAGPRPNHATETVTT